MKISEVDGITHSEEAILLGGERNITGREDLVKIQTSVIMVIHEVVEVYLVRLLEDGHICATHAK